MKRVLSIHNCAWCRSQHKVISEVNFSHRVIIINVNAANNKMLSHLWKIVFFIQPDGNFITVEHLFSSSRPFEKILIIYYFPLLMVVLIICSDSFLGASFNFSFSASFSAFFFSYSSCLQFSSCARTNIFTKLSRVDTTIEGEGKITKVAMVSLVK